MRKRSTSRSRAISPVISVVIISVVVFAVGGAIWAFSQGAMTITAEDYAEDVIEMTDVISERFIIEMVSYDNSPFIAVIMEEAVGIGTGSQTVFYLDHIPVVAPTESISVDGVVQTIVTDYTIDYAIGKITFVSAPAAEIAIMANYNYETNRLYVWIFNYGTVDIEVKVQVKGVTCPAAEDEWIEIPSKDMVPFPTINLSANVGEELNIKAYTKRGNNAYYKYFIP